MDRQPIEVAIHKVLVRYGSLDAEHFERVLKTIVGYKQIEVTRRQVRKSVRKALEHWGVTK
jgi:hypothetical protein